MKGFQKLLNKFLSSKSKNDEELLFELLAFAFLTAISALLVYNEAGRNALISCIIVWLGFANAVMTIRSIILLVDLIMRATKGKKSKTKEKEREIDLYN